MIWALYLLAVAGTAVTSLLAYAIVAVLQVALDDECGRRL